MAESSTVLDRVTQRFQGLILEFLHGDAAASGNGVSFWRQRSRAGSARRVRASLGRSRAPANAPESASPAELSGCPAWAQSSERMRPVPATIRTARRGVCAIPPIARAPKCHEPKTARLIARRFDLLAHLKAAVLPIRERDYKRDRRSPRPLCRHSPASTTRRPYLC